MSLQDDLNRAYSEEDVKDAYIKAFGLKPKQYRKGLVDIQTASVWFEAKGGSTPSLLMFAQLLVYIRSARLRGETLPAFLAVIDPDKGAILETEHALPVLDDETITWPVSGSAADKVLAAQIAPYIHDHFTTYPVSTMGDEFCAAIKNVIRQGRIIKTAITPNNLRQAFDKWVEMVGSELGVANPSDYATLFFADLMTDGEQAAYASVGADLVTLGRRPAFVLRGSVDGPLRVTNVRAYNDFWSIYARPPEERHRRWLLERRDSLLPIDEQKFKGAFYTPLHIVDKAYEQLSETLGEDWQDRYIVWDMCCGVGNLETKHSNYRNVYMSTLDAVDLEIMRANNICPGAVMFQYDYLNDDITDFGEIDYAITNKVPPALRQAIADAKAGVEGAKPILVLINPPYAEATNVSNINDAGDNSGLKKGVSSTRISHSMSDLGYAARELFVQFVHRIVSEMPHATLAMFSTLKYVNAPNFAEFRRRWTAKYLGGFVVHSRAFDGLKGDFPIGFLIWDLSINQPASRIDTLALDRNGEAIATKAFYRVLPRQPLPDWIIRPRSNSTPALPLKNALSPTTSTKDVRGDRWADGAIGSMIAKGNDFQNSGQQTALLSSGYCSAGAFFVTEQNLREAAVMFAVRMLIPHTWINHNDQFLQPAVQLSEDFTSDCLVWMLYSGKNLAAGADGLHWNGRTWSLVNHFVPYTEAQVGVRGRFESDFLAQYLRGLTFSAEAKAVLDEGLKLWRQFHSTNFPRKIRDEYMLGRPDAGWYQIRRALQSYSDTEMTDFDPFNAAYAALTEKLRPLVYDLGFLPK